MRGMWYVIGAHRSSWHVRWFPGIIRKFRRKMVMAQTSANTLNCVAPAPAIRWCKCKMHIQVDGVCIWFLSFVWCFVANSKMVTATAKRSPWIIGFRALGNRQFIYISTYIVVVWFFSSLNVDEAKLAHSCQFIVRDMVAHMWYVIVHLRMCLSCVRPSSTVIFYWF